jgi:hypothetical protein
MQFILRFAKYEYKIPFRTDVFFGNTIFPSDIRKIRRVSYSDQTQMIFSFNLITKFCLFFDYTMGREQFGIGDFN